MITEIDTKALHSALQRAQTALATPSASMNAFVLRLAAETDMGKLRQQLAREVLDASRAINPGTRITNESVLAADAWSRTVPENTVRGLALGYRALTEQLAAGVANQGRRTHRSVFDRLTNAVRRRRTRG